MLKGTCARVVSVAVASAFLAGAAFGQSPDPNSPRWKGVVSLRDFLGSSGEKALDTFLEEKVAPSLRDQLGSESLRESLKRLRLDFANKDFQGAMPQGPFAVQAEFSGDKSISFEMEPEPPHRFVRIGKIGESAECCGSPGTSTSKPAEITTFSELREQLTKQAEAEEFSGVVLVAKDGKSIFHEAYGYADKSRNVPNRPNTKFNIGSLNKLFTTVAVYQLIEAGKLALDDTIGKYLPQFPEDVRSKVTIKHLLEHRSGWAAYWENPTWNARKAELRTLDDYMAFIKDIPLDFQPGTRKQYSNTGYEVLGAIIEKATGRSYYDYVRENVYKPTGMHDTDAYEHDRPVPNRAIGYAGGGYGEDNSSMLAIKGTAAGGGYSTAGDLMRFAKALNDRNLMPGKEGNRLRRGGFAGGGPGVNAMLDLSVAGDHTVIVLSNLDPPTATRIGRQISQMLRSGATGIDAGPKYRIGVGLKPQDVGVAISFLVPGAPGERDGLEAGDVILALNGKTLGDDPIAQFDDLLTKSDPIVMRVQRGGDIKRVTVKPEPLDDDPG